MSTEGREKVSGTLKESNRSFMSAMLSTNSYSSTSCEVSSSFQTRNFESPPRGTLRNGTNGTNGTNGLNLPDVEVLKSSPGAVRVTESFVYSDAKSTYSTSKFSECKNQFLEGKTGLLAGEPRGGLLAGEPRGGLLAGEVRRNGTSVWTGNAVSSKSFIQQRVERLYGPGALAQGFFKRTSTTQHAEQTTASPCEASPQPSNHASLPVLRHLRPEFRAQLSLGSRKAVDTAPKTSMPVLQQQVSVESVTDILPAAPEVVLPIQQPGVVSTESREEGSGQLKDGAFFLKVLKEEIDRINALVTRTERDMVERGGGSMPEEAEGKVRAVIGQARLLVKQKLQQFEGLCHKNMAQSCEEQFPTTEDDLAGFWDMVQLQVCQVHTLFRELDSLRAAGWKEEEVVLTDAVDSNTSPKRRSIGSTKRAAKPAANEEARKAREEARRKMMEEKRREMREKNKNKSEEEKVEIYVPQESAN